MASECYSFAWARIVVFVPGPSLALFMSALFPASGAVGAVPGPLARWLRHRPATVDRHRDRP